MILLIRFVCKHNQRENFSYFIIIPVKEIQLMHRAPVVGILILDGHSVPLPEPLEAAHDLSKSPDMQGSHQLLVISEEQLKVGMTVVYWIGLDFYKV